MSLSEQLNNLQQKQVKIGVGAVVPAFVLDKQTAKVTSVEVLYTMAILGFSKFKKLLKGQGKELGQELLSESSKELNRNKLNKAQNKQLSNKLIKFILLISPYFLNECCQIVLEYLLRNFKVHVFQAEPLSVIYIQYWNHPLYVKLIKNIDAKGAKLGWIKQIQNDKKINLTYVIKSITYTRSVLESLLVYVKAYIKEQIKESTDMEIDIILSRPTVDKLTVESSPYVYNDPKNFVAEVVVNVLEKGIQGYSKDFLQFAYFCSKIQLRSANDLSIFIIFHLLQYRQYGPEWGKKILTSLLQREYHSNILDFCLLLWQRYPQIFDHHFTAEILKLQEFPKYITHTPKDKSMVFYNLFTMFFHPDFKDKVLCMRILELLTESIKQSKFVIEYKSRFYTSIFSVVEQRQKLLEEKQKQLLRKFICDYLLFELVEFGSEFVQIIKSYVPEQYQGKKGYEKLKLKQSKKKEEIQVMVINQQQIESMDQEQEEQEEAKQGENSTLLNYVNNVFGKQFMKLDYKSPQVIEVIQQIISSYYEKKQSITRQQKNHLFDQPNVFKLYTINHFIFDLENEDFHTPIKYLLKQPNYDISQRVIDRLLEVPKIFEDILFRELLRLAIRSLIVQAKQNYNRVVNYLGRIYHQFQKMGEHFRWLNQIMTRITEQLFKQCGLKQGKYYKLISCHVRVFAKIYQSAPIINQEIVRLYDWLIETFTPENAYAVIIGIANILPYTQKGNRDAKNFIKKVFIPHLVSNPSLRNICVMIEQILIFCCHLLLEGGEIEADNLILPPSVAKKMIVSFFGLSKKKQKRKIVRKLLMFLYKLFRSTGFVSIFEESLSEMEEEGLKRIVRSYSSIYFILFQIVSKIKGPLNSLVQGLKVENLKLIPLELKIDVFAELLPKEEAYSILSTDLSQGSKKKYPNLEALVNILPDELTDSWLSFTAQCLTRNYCPSQQTISQLLRKPISQNLIEFISNLIQFAKEQSIKHIDKIMEIAYEVCSQSNQYSLALIYRITKYLGERAHPYLSQLFKISIQVESPYTKMYLKQTVNSLHAPTLLQLIKEQHKTVSHFENYTTFLLLATKKLPYSAVAKSCQHFFSRSLNHLLSQQRDYTDLHEHQAEILESYVLKMNEDELRKLVIDYLRWSSQINKNDAFIFNPRKSLLMILFKKLSKKLGELFNNFYGYIFESLLEDFSNFNCFEEKVSTKDSAKRRRERSNYEINSSYFYLRSCLEALSNLFENDPNSQFMDSTKFDVLAPKLADIFNYVQFGFLYQSLTQESLHSCLITLFKNTKDDYKLKFANNQILQILRTKNQVIQLSIYRLMDKIPKYLDHRVLIFADDLIPLLLEASNSRNQQIKKTVESIVYQIQNISGQKIDRYAT